MTRKHDFFKANFIYLIILLGFVIIRILSALDALSFMGEYGSYLMNIILQIGLMFVLPMLLYPKLRKTNFKKNAIDLGYKKISFVAILIAILIGIIVYILNIGVSSFFNFIITLLGYEKFTSSSTTSYPIYMLFVNLLFTAVLPAICEETTHRGMLLHGYKDLGVKRAVILSSLLFGLTHLNIEQFFYATIIGLFLGFLTVMTSSIFPAMIVHFMNNAISVVLSFLISTNAKFAAQYSQFFTNLTSGNFFVVICGMFLLVCLLLFLLGFLTWILIKRTAIANFNNLAHELTKKKLRQELMNEEDQESVISNSIAIGVEHDNRRLKIYFPIEEMGYPLERRYKPNKHDKAMLIACLSLASLITLFTFIWGII